MVGDLESLVQRPDSPNDLMKKDEIQILFKSLACELTGLASVDINWLIVGIGRLQRSLISHNRVVVDDRSVQQADRVGVVLQAGVRARSVAARALRLGLEEVILRVAFASQAIDPSDHDVAADHVALLRIARNAKRHVLIII